ncbi:MAG: AAA family ATPase [Cyanothece sp. SIO1E1]|nr:AAA family ATPase [Cyanothece sp. SIO1E1]
MPIKPVEPFANNWAYLKTELSWLDRLLRVAVARRRQETKEVDRVAQSKADRVTSHWWKGLVSLGIEPAYDDSPKPPTTGNSTLKSSYQQQLEARIQMSCQRGIDLGLPLLRERLKLTMFEKNLILMSLAPELNQRYVQIYNYLQGDNLQVKTNLLTVDLALRLLCRNDAEWQQARQALTTTSPLIQNGWLKLLSSPEETLLNRRLQLADTLVNYLLAEQPAPADLEKLLATPPTSESIHPPLLATWYPRVKWSDLILPTATTDVLQHLCHRMQLQTQAQIIGSESTADVDSGAQLSPAYGPGLIVLLVGTAGTGKTLAAEAIAAALNTALTGVDLALSCPGNHGELMQATATQTSQILLVKSAQIWFGRSSLIETAELHRWLHTQRQRPSITLLSVQMLQSIKPSWRQRCDYVVQFTFPDPAARLQLWKRAFPPQISLERKINWSTLARQLPVSGGEIQAIAQAAVGHATMESQPPKVKLHHLQLALEQKGKKLKLGKAKNMPDDITLGYDPTRD